MKGEDSSIVGWVLFSLEGNKGIPGKNQRCRQGFRQGSTSRVVSGSDFSHCDQVHEWTWSQKAYRVRVSINVFIELISAGIPPTAVSSAIWIEGLPRGKLQRSFLGDPGFGRMN
jgi:hypothetical protein